MPTTIIEMPPRLDPPRKLWTRKEFQRLAEFGAFDQQKVELINGELINKMGKNQPHVISLTLMQYWLARVFGERLVCAEWPIDVAPEDNPTNEPEPDIIVLNRDLTSFASRKPRPEDLQLVVEVADTSLGFDLTRKADLYARAGILEYWVLDIGNRRLIVHRGPQSGRYVSVVAYSSGESTAPLGAPNSQLRIGDVLPQ